MSIRGPIGGALLRGSSPPVRGRVRQSSTLGRRIRGDRSLDRGQDRRERVCSPVLSVNGRLREDAILDEDLVRHGREERAMRAVFDE